MKASSISILCLSIVQVFITTFPRLSSGENGGKCDVEGFTRAPELEEIDEKCKETLGEETSPEVVELNLSCIEICILTKLQIITSEGVEEDKWEEWVAKQFPAEFVPAIVEKVKPCGELYDSVPRNSMCDENDDFHRCIEDAVDDVCEI